jgi:hypothetical protein
MYRWMSTHRRGRYGKQKDEVYFFDPNRMDFSRRRVVPTSGAVYTMTYKTADFTAKDYVVYLVSAVTNTVIVTLPLASLSTDKLYYIKKIDSSGNYVVIQPQSGDFIDGQTAYNITAQFECITVISNGIANWWII